MGSGSKPRALARNNKIINEMRTHRGHVEQNNNYYLLLFYSVHWNCICAEAYRVRFEMLFSCFLHSISIFVETNSWMYQSMLNVISNLIRFQHLMANSVYKYIFLSSFSAKLQTMRLATSVDSRFP